MRYNRRMNTSSFHTAIASKHFVWILIVAATAVYLAVDHLLSGYIQQILKFVIFFVFIAGLVRHSQINKEKGKAHADEDAA